MGPMRAMTKLFSRKWLHYLAIKLLDAKRLRPPISKKPSTNMTTTYTEEECYHCLVEMEDILKRSIDLISPSRKGRRKTHALPKGTTLQTAADVVQLATGRGWVRWGIPTFVMYIYCNHVPSSCIVHQIGSKGRIMAIYVLLTRSYLFHVEWGALYVKLDSSVLTFAWLWR